MDMIFTVNNLLFGLGIFIANIIQGLTAFSYAPFNTITGLTYCKSCG